MIVINDGFSKKCDVDDVHDGDNNKYDDVEN